MKKTTYKIIIVFVITAISIYAGTFFFSNNKPLPPEWIMRSSVEGMLIEDYYRLLKKSKLKDGTPLNLSWSEKDFVFKWGYKDNQLNGKEYHLQIKSPEINETLVFQPNVYPSSKEFPSQHVVLLKGHDLKEFKDAYHNKIRSKLTFKSALPSEVLTSKISRSNKTVSDIIQKYKFLNKDDWTVEYGTYTKEITHNGIYAKFIIRPVESDWYFEIKQRYKKIYYDTKTPYYVYYSHYHSKFLHMDLTNTLDMVIFKINEDNQ